MHRSMPLELTTYILHIQVLDDRSRDERLLTLLGKYHKSQRYLSHHLQKFVFPISFPGKFYDFVV